MTSDDGKGGGDMPVVHPLPVGDTDDPAMIVYPRSLFHWSEFARTRT